MIAYNENFIYKKTDDLKSVYDFRLKKSVKYYNIIFAFDIETSSTYIDSEKFAFMYEWTFGEFDDIQNEFNIVYGRNWESFTNLYNKLVKEYDTNLEKRVIIWVHNLGYEFQFMRKYFNWENVFSIDERKPVKALTKEGIEFRDSYILSAMSLALVAKNLTKYKINKLVGDLDYKLVRTCKTLLSEQELKYCEYDVLIILYYIDEQRDLFEGDITKIPLTNTGRVRDFVRRKCFFTSKSHKKTSQGKFKRYSELMQSLNVSRETYGYLKLAFAGGYTHANAFYSGKVLANVSSIDFTSSYPYVMLSEKYPMSTPEKIENVSYEDFEIMLDNSNVGMIFEITFYDIYSTASDDYISESKCTSINNPVINNGRVHSADELTIVITNVDFSIIEKSYKFESYTISVLYKFYMTYLPKAIINSILELYSKKTTLKGVKGFESEYLVSKQMLNSVYGMCVTDIVRDNIEYTDVWKKGDVDINDCIERYNKSKRRFLYYPWGIWVTVYARRNLWQGILEIDTDYVYSDTDSIKFLNYDKHKTFIENYNLEVENKLKKMCDFMNIDFNLCKPKTKKGVEKLIGVWDFEGTYSKFKTLGAKRYLVKEGEEYHLTLAGLSKKEGCKYIVEKGKTDTGIFKFFNNNMYIPPVATGKNTHTYIDDVMEKFVTDYQGNIVLVKALSSVHLDECDFTLSISQKYQKFLSNLIDGYISKEW